MPSLPQLLLTFPDLALPLAVGGHASTQTCLVENSCSIHSRASRTTGTVSSAATHDCIMSLSFVCTLFSRGASLCPGLYDSSGLSVFLPESCRCGLFHLHCQGGDVCGAHHACRLRHLTSTRSALLGVIVNVGSPGSSHRRPHP